MRYLLVFLISFFPLQTFALPGVALVEKPTWIISRTPDLQAVPQDREVVNGFYYKVYDRQVSVASQSSYFDYLIQIVNERGVQELSQFSIDFSTAFQQVKIHAFNIIRDGSVVYSLKTADIQIVNQEKEQGSYMFHGLYQAIIIPKDLRKGDLLEFSYTLQGRNPVYNNKYTDAFAFVSQTPIMNLYTSVLVPAERSLRFACNNGAIAPTESQKGAEHIYDWPKQSLSAYEGVADLSPSWYISYPYVEFSEYKSWAEIADWGLRLADHYKQKLPVGLIKKSDAWYEAAGEDPTRYLQYVTRFVQDQIRYFGMEIGEYTHRPHTPSETFESRYGDCKDKSLLLVSLLREKGIPAYMTLVHTERKGKIDQGIPSVDKFNHVIVKAIINKRVYWIDPTLNSQRGSIERNFTPDYQKGLVLSESKPGIESIFLRNSGKINLEETIYLPSSKDGVGLLEVGTSYEEGEADRFRSRLSMGVRALETEYENYYSNLFGRAKIKEDLSVEDDSLENTIHVAEIYTIDQVWSEEGDKLRFDLIGRPLLDRLINPSNHDGAQPIAIMHPMDITYKAVIVLETGWNVVEEKTHIFNNSYTFSFSSEVKGTELELTYHLKSFKDHIPVVEVAQYKMDYKAILEKVQFPLLFDNKLAQLQNTAKTEKDTVNMIALFALIAGMVASFFLMRKWNKASSDLTSYEQEPIKIAGWLYLLGIVLVITVAVFTFKCFSFENVSTQTWLVIRAAYGSGLELYMLLEIFLIGGFTMMSYWLCYWFWQRRDIFPKMFILLSISNVVIAFIDWIIFETLSNTNTALSDTAREFGVVLTRNLIFTVTWTAALLASRRTANTFSRAWNTSSETGIISEVETRGEPEMR